MSNGAHTKMLENTCMSLKKKVMTQHGLVNNLNYSNKNLHFYTK